MADSGSQALQTVALHSSEAPLQATFAPGAGMVCCSLRHDGAELLAPRGGLRAYAERGSTMGIPLLYPWANRLAAFSYPAGERVVQLAHDSPLLKLDEHGMPIHGVLPSALSWELIEEPREGSSASLLAAMRWDRPELLALFPYRHTVQLRARLERATLTIETEVATAEAREMPVSFGYHPYLAPPDGERAAWRVALPVRERLLLDERMIPTGAREPLRRRSFALGERSFDDAFAGLLERPLFTLETGVRTIELEFLRGYRFAQLYSPAGESFACWEPMTAPTNALVSREQLRWARPGEPFRAAFSISVAAAA